MRRILLAVSCGAILVACGVPTGSGAPAGSDYRLYEAAASASSQFISVVDSRSHATMRRLPLGTPTGDWAHLYSVNGTELVDTDPRTGATLHSLPLDTEYSLPPATASGLPGGLSQNGKWLVLESWEGRSPSPPTATHLLVVDTSFARPPARVDLSGWFQFDTVSNDGSRLYLIEYLSGADYRVRIYQVLNHQLDPTVVVDKLDPKESMTGWRLGGVPSPDGSWLFSVYARDKDNAFIHALNLDGAPIAFCLDLAGSGYSSNPDEARWALALSSDGSRLYAANAAMGLVSEIDTSGPSLKRTAHIAAAATSTTALVTSVEAKELGANTAVLSGDGRVMVTAGSSGVVWIDTSTLSVTRRALTDWHVWSLGLSPDGGTLFALKDSGEVAQLSMASGAVESTFDARAGYPIALMRVEAA